MICQPAQLRSTKLILKKSTTSVAPSWGDGGHRTVVGVFISFDSYRISIVLANCSLARGSSRAVASTTLSTSSTRTHNYLLNPLKRDAVRHRSGCCVGVHVPQRERDRVAHQRTGCGVPCSGKTDATRRTTRRDLQGDSILMGHGSMGRRPGTKKCATR